MGGILELKSTLACTGIDSETQFLSQRRSYFLKIISRNSKCLMLSPSEKQNQKGDMHVHEIHFKILTVVRAPKV